MRPVRTRRSAFTLLEVLVVMGILAVLFSLLLGSYFKIYIAAANMEARREITGLEKAVQAFCLDHGVDYIPSVLDPSGKEPISNAWLQRVFPRTRGALRLPKAALEGHEVLVLMLGGPQNKQSGVRGWSTDASDPCADYGQRRVYYDFKPTRLLDTGKGNDEFRYYAYLDPWGVQPYAYYCSKRLFQDTRGEFRHTPPSYNVDDCVALAPLRPYSSQNLSSFQIICAGRDTRWGSKGSDPPPNQWTPQNASKLYPLTGPGKEGNDDIANFSAKTLGAIQ